MLYSPDQLFYHFIVIYYIKQLSILKLKNLFAEHY